MADTQWYTSLKKPSLTPPNWVFGPVWTTLYIMMGFSLYLYLQKSSNPYALTLFFTQLALNLSWSPTFFVFRQICPALFIILLTIVLTCLTATEFWKKSKLAALFLVPYIAWMSLASYLNLYICVNN